MADILSAVVGSAGTSDQQTIQDRVTQQMQRERLSQILALFQGGGLYDFAGGGGSAYMPTSFSNDISAIARQNMFDAGPMDYSNLMRLDDYRNAFAPVTQTYQDTLTGLDSRTERAIQEAGGTYQGIRGNVATERNAALGRSYGDYATGTGAAAGAYGTNVTGINDAYNAAIARGDYDLARSIQSNAENASYGLQNAETNYNRGLGINFATAGEGLRRAEANTQRALDTNEANYLRSLGVADADANRSLATQDFNRARALELGIGTTGNYIDQIARPRLEQVAALQGLESGGMLPASIARATAEYAMPYLQSLETAYGSNQANTLNSLMGLKGNLSGQASAQAASALSQLTGIEGTIDEQLMALQSGLSGQNQQIQANIYNALGERQAAAQQTAQQGNISLGSQRLGTTATAGNTYQNNINQLAQAMMANNVTLEQAGISAESALGQQLMSAQAGLRTQQQQGITTTGNNYMGNANTFAQSLPGASTALSMAPLQMQGARAATLQAFQPLADFPRQLQEADLLRRQGLFTTAFTGIPFAPSTSTSGSTETANLVENLFG